MNKAAARQPPPIPKKYTRERTAHFWGQAFQVTPAVADAHLGDGRQLLWFEPLNTRPNYYLIRIDSSWGDLHDDADDADDNDNLRDHVDEIIDALVDEFGEMEREREHLEDDLREQGIDPDDDNTDLAGNEDRLGWPVLSLDSGYSWGVMAVFKGRKWTE